MGRTLYVTKKCDFTEMKCNASNPGSQNKGNKIPDESKRLIYNLISRPILLREIVPELVTFSVYLSVPGMFRSVATIFSTRSAIISGVTAFRQR